LTPKALPRPIGTSPRRSRSINPAMEGPQQSHKVAEVDDRRCQQWSEEDLVRHAKGGSADCFGELTQRYRPVLLRAMTRRLMSDHDAEEVVQETFVRALAALPRYEPVRPFGAWLMVIARNVAATRQRRVVLQSDALDDAPSAAGALTPAELVMQGQERANLWHAAGRILPKAQFDVLRWRYAQDYSIEQIAGLSGKSQVHVRVLLHRARQSLLRSATFRQAAGLGDESP
jgi:RNA polymerase sigma-70 factor, ECF subfamily